MRNKIKPFKVGVWSLAGERQFTLWRLEEARPRTGAILRGFPAPHLSRGNKRTLRGWAHSGSSNELGPPGALCSSCSALLPGGELCIWGPLPHLLLFPAFSAHSLRGAKLLKSTPPHLCQALSAHSTPPPGGTVSLSPPNWVSCVSCALPSFPQ